MYQTSNQETIDKSIKRPEIAIQSSLELFCDAEIDGVLQRLQSCIISQNSDDDEIIDNNDLLIVDSIDVSADLLSMHGSVHFSNKKIVAIKSAQTHPEREMLIPVKDQSLFAKLNNFSQLVYTPSIPIRRISSIYDENATDNSEDQPQIKQKALTMIQKLSTTKN